MSWAISLEFKLFYFRYLFSTIWYTYQKELYPKGKKSLPITLIFFSYNAPDLHQFFSGRKREMGSSYFYGICTSYFLGGIDCKAQMSFKTPPHLFLPDVLITRTMEKEYWSTENAIQHCEGAIEGNVCKISGYFVLFGPRRWIGVNQSWPGEILLKAKKVLGVYIYLHLIIGKT